MLRGHVIAPGRVRAGAVRGAGGEFKWVIRQGWPQVCTQSALICLCTRSLGLGQVVPCPGRQGVKQPADFDNCPELGQWTRTMQWPYRPPLLWARVASAPLGFCRSHGIGAAGM